MSEGEAGRYTALIMAGSRPGGDPMARAAGVSHKCLLPVDGTPMIRRVVTALLAAPSVGRVMISIDAPDLLEEFFSGPESDRIGLVQSAETPSLSALAAIEAAGGAAPMLITTADHPLLVPALIERFCREAEASGADIVAGLAPEDVIRTAFPESRRTYLRFRDGRFSGCNLFALLRTEGTKAIRLWRRVERDRKRPWRIAKAFGLPMLLGYLAGWLTLDAALARLSRLAGAKAGVVVLPVAEAAVDVDKPEDLVLVEAILRGRA
jgi:CTP:molybdopterin cytidylyltransferase MocA